MPCLLGERIHVPTIGSNVETRDGAIQVTTHDPGSTALRPCDRGDAAQAVDSPVIRLEKSVERAAVRSELRIAPGTVCRRELLRLTSLDIHPEQKRVRECISRSIAITARSENDTATVRRPDRTELLAVIRATTRESVRRNQLRTRQQILRLGAGLQGLHQHVRLAFRLDPLVPVADRKRVIDPRVVLARLALFCKALVVLVGHRAAINGTDKKKMRTVG